MHYETYKREQLEHIREEWEDHSLSYEELSDINMFLEEAIDRLPGYEA